MASLRSSPARRGFAAGLSGFVSWTAAGSVAVATGLAVITPSGDGVEIRYGLEEMRQIEILPLHRVGAVRYFSAGVGLEERRTEYPPFPLKLIFTEGQKPFTAGVSATIRSTSDDLVLTVPEEHVIGPWLFVDLPDGSYRITVTKGAHTQDLDRVTVRGGEVRTLYVRLPGR